MRSYLLFAAGLIFSLLCVCVDSKAQGIFIDGVGAVNRSMTSASVAAPLDAAGAINYNPATMSGLKSSETEMGLELLWADMSVFSRVDAYNLSGSTDDDSGVNPIPAFALVSKNPGSDLSLGLAFSGVAGFRTDYPASTTNPILFPQGSGGLGRTVGSADFYQFAPALAYKVTSSTSIGFSPLLTIGKLESNPLIFAQPNANGTYPGGIDPNYRYGGGFQVGVYYEGQSGVNLGAAYKSPQWMESFNVNTTDELGAPRRASFDFDLPMIASIGASYTGIQQWLFAVDVRYFDYRNAPGFDKSGYSEQGAVRGLGWDSIFSTSAGVQYSPLEKLSLRLGYTYNQNPISDGQSMFNVGSPLITQNLLGIGCSYEVVKNTLISLAYLHGFENSVSGPFVVPQGEVPGTSVKNKVSAEAIAVALTYRY